MAVTKHPHVSTFAMHRGLTSYEQPLRAVKDFIDRMNAFQAVSIARYEKNRENDTAHDTERQLLACPDARAENMDAKTDKLADQFSNIVLILKKVSAERPLDRGENRSSRFGFFEKSRSFARGRYMKRANARIPQS